MKISEVIRNRIDRSAELYRSNDNISKFIKDENEKDQLLNEVAEKFEDVLQSLVIDTKNDHNTKETAKRVAKMFIQETFAGRYDNPPKITTFPNVRKLDEMYVTGPISVRSTCAHHFMPIKGVCYIGIYPGDNVLGLSKFNRIVDWIASRPQIQEEMTYMIADEVEKLIRDKTTINYGTDESGSNFYEYSDLGVAVLIQAEHFCLTHRGVKEHNSAMTTSVLRGKFLNKPNLKLEFFDIVKLMQDKK